MPLSTRVWQAVTADRYKLICPRGAWHANSEGLHNMEKKPPNIQEETKSERREQLAILPWKASRCPPPQSWPAPCVRCAADARAAVRAPRPGNAMLQWARLLPGSRGSIPSYSAPDSAPTALPRCIALHYIAFPARRHCCITVRSSSKM